MPPEKSPRSFLKTEARCVSFPFLNLLGITKRNKHFIKTVRGYKTFFGDIEANFDFGI